MPNSVWTALVAKAAALGGGRRIDPDTTTQIRELYGSGPRGGLNVTAAAADLGVSASTIRRWARTDTVPNSAGGGAFVTTWDGSNAARGHTDLTAAATGGSVVFRGVVAVSNDRRNRTLNMYFDADQINQLIAAGQQSDAAALAVLEDLTASHGFGGDVSLTIQDLKIT